MLNFTLIFLQKEYYNSYHLIKMNDLKETENSHRILPNVIGSEYSDDESSISDFRKIFLSTPESIKIFQIWFSKQNDLDYVNTFLKKLNFFSLSTHTIMALFLYMLYEKEEDVPADIIDINNDSSRKMVAESIHLFQRLLKD